MYLGIERKRIKVVGQYSGMTSEIPILWVFELEL